ncbi:uncharacterized protein LOC130720417 [Lotus japonicus]|uniref:uncharacterized protein LOC130720417 n=1 Tax=Lotus japonicus TaxID=34305 RepID=UPI0025868046|nr:uncharacterized protein LOC130720417 [Lotus japonicus]
MKQQQRAVHNVVASSREEMTGRDAVVCPKPRRLGLFNDRSFRWHLSCQVEPCDSYSSSSNPLESILNKDFDCEIIDQPYYPVVASPPPFFCGSPPSRVANPLIQDARFGDENISPLSPSSWVVVPAPSSPSSSSRKGGGCVRSNFGNNPAVRVEGFDCLDRDRRNCSIPALA